jgi:hypothetical protein
VWTDVDGASLAVVRIAYGSVGLLVVVRTVVYGWVDSLYVGPSHHFTYAGFGWVAPPSRLGAYALLAVMGVACVAVSLGWCTRLALAVFLFGFVWFELIEVTTYLNHYWFVTLLGLLLVALPCDAVWSLGARRRASRRFGTTVPLGAVWLVRAQVGVVYVFAGLAKLQADWLLHGMPLRIWLPARADLPVVGTWLDESWAALWASWAGAGFDLLVVPALCWRRTRPFAWAAVVVFHVVTWRLFPIGVFPWLMIAASTVFFAPNWPRRFARTFAPKHEARVPATRAAHGPRARAAVALLGGAWLAVQLALPLRHWLVPGDARWTNEGYRFAWVVLLTEKGGDVSFRVTDRRTGERWRETAQDLYTANQWRMMATEPELVRQAAHAIAAREAARGRDVEVRADVFVSWDGRPAARLVDPSVDLAREPWRLHQEWILPAPRAAPP